MEIFDSLNLYLATHPVMFDQLVTAFRIKYWIMSCLAIYFMLLPYRERKRKEKEAVTKDGQFLA